MSCKPNYCKRLSKGVSTHGSKTGLQTLLKSAIINNGIPGWFARNMPILHNTSELYGRGIYTEPTIYTEENSMHSSRTYLPCGSINACLQENLILEDINILVPLAYVEYTE